MLVPTSTTLCHLLPDLIETIVGCRIMYFFADEGMIITKGKTASRTKATYWRNTLPLPKNPLSDTRLYIPLRHKKQ
ncbi:hypothetical protein [Phocaeicola dorei]|uniref:hypothetical protein n=1 Tax=Phocaeicola dorei TaxID=357276 RepID=UPI00356363E8